MRRFPYVFSHLSAGAQSVQEARGTGRLVELPDFGHNPGALKAHIYLPAGLLRDSPLVVVLHGCTQNAKQYDVGAGWSQLADEHGFALLFPEQQRPNNPNLCFNWFLPQDARRDRGEALSIKNMVAAMVKGHGLDPQRIFVTGLSAGGAMAGVMLASYPELFAGGAIIAGLPYGTATNVPQALERMRGQGLPDDGALADLLRVASDHQGPWPTLSVWHGTSDVTVDPTNAQAIIGQWRVVHGLGREPTRREVVDGYKREIWCDRSGRECIESYTIMGMAHGTPISTSGEEACGQAGPYMLDKHISSTRHICRFWSLAGEATVRDGQSEIIDADFVISSEVSAANFSEQQPKPATGGMKPPVAPKSENGVGKVIEDALRAAGLMR